MRWFVTGGTGFIGRHLLQRLQAEGYEVRALTRRPPPGSATGIEWVQGDLDDHEVLVRAVAGCDGVIHLAGLVAARDAQAFFHVNATGTAHMVQAAAVQEQPLRFVYISSLAAVGPAQDVAAVDETTPPHPVSPYGASKLAGERFVRAAPESIAWTIIRPPVVYGPGDRAILPYYRLTRRGWHVFLGDPQRQFSLVYVRDLVEAIVRVAGEAKTAGVTYFVADPRPYTWMDVARTMTRVQDVTRVRRVVVPAWLLYAIATINELVGKLRRQTPFLNRAKVRELLYRRWVCSSERFQRDLDFTRWTSLEEGIRETVEWYRAHGWL